MQCISFTRLATSTLGAGPKGSCVTLLQACVCVCGDSVCVIAVTAASVGSRKSIWLQLPLLTHRQAEKQAEQRRAEVQRRGRGAGGAGVPDPGRPRRPGGVEGGPEVPQVRCWHLTPCTLRPFTLFHMIQISLHCVPHSLACKTHSMLVLQRDGAGGCGRHQGCCRCQSAA